jgi:hypothetical protein
MLRRCPFADLKIQVAKLPRSLKYDLDNGKKEWCPFRISKHTTYKFGIPSSTTLFIY